jgi:hypothetical protein
VSAFVVSVLVLAAFGVLIVGAALFRIYGAERLRRRRQVSTSRRAAENESAPRRSWG